MRLRLFRGRSWWPGRGLGRRAATRAGRAATSQQPRQAPRPGGVRGSHRRTGSSGPATGDLARWRDEPLAGQPVWPGRAASGRPAPNSVATARTGSGRSAAGLAGGGGLPGAGAAGAGLAEIDSPGTSSSPAAQAGSPRSQAREGIIAATATQAAGRAAIRTTSGNVGQATATAMSARSATRARSAVAGRHSGRAGAEQPWYAAARTSRTATGMRHCGRLEDVLIREWATDEQPAPGGCHRHQPPRRTPGADQREARRRARCHPCRNRRRARPRSYGSASRACRCRPGRATWDACAGAYGDRKIIVGSRPSPTPDVMCHEVGHALDDLDGSEGAGSQTRPTSGHCIGRCLPHMASEFHRHGGALGRREFFADAFAAIASSQRPALVEMLSGDTRTALDVMLYFNVRYGM